MSIKIKLVRVDKRLLHATVALNWNYFIDIDTIILVDPYYEKDPFIADVMQLCLPKTLKLKIYSVQQFLEFINGNYNVKAIVIFPNLAIAYEAVKAGFYTKEIQIPYPASRIMMRSLSDYFSDEDIERIRYIQSKGIKLFFQTSPFDNKNYSIFTK